MDIFLSYNSADHSFVENVARKLCDEGLKPFLDRWYLEPGIRWRPKLEETLSSCKAVAIFVGPGEMGSWQQREVDVALDLQARNPKLPVIPVLLPGCEPPLGFLRQLTWVDLRSQALDSGIIILAKSARGQPPGPNLQIHVDSVRASVCPYRGLLHFREEDALFFFGREAAIDRLADAVQRQPFVAVVGASGSGKSSVVRAGLVTRLRSDRHTAWETVILVPTDQPLKALARALVPLLEPTLDEVDRMVQASKLAEHFRSGTISLYDIVERILEKQSGTNRVLIVVDQFEELYTLTSDEEARRRFLDELLAASSRAASKANVALTLRGDFVGKALAYRPLSDRLQDAQINLGPMNREELDCAIRKPAEKIQLEFEPGLVRRILNDVGDEPGNLPLLEFVLKELWEKRRGRVLLNETYDAIGGLKGAVATKADELFKGLSSAEQTILQRVFLRIVRPTKGGLDTRRRAAFTELPPEGAKLVLKLANERLLVTNQSASGQEQTVEVAHEALISNWGMLRAWVNEDREFLLWRDRLGMLLTEWERTEESDETLLRGPFLIEAQKWFDQRSQDLSDQERKFISASREKRERLAREEKERRERELDAAKKLADAQKERAAEAERNQHLEAERALEAQKYAMEQKRAASKLRWSAWILAAVALLAVSGATFGVWQSGEAARQKDEAARQKKLRDENDATDFNDALRRATDSKSPLDQRIGFIFTLSKYWKPNYEFILANTLASMIANDDNQAVMESCAEVIGLAYDGHTSEVDQVRLRKMLYGDKDGNIGVVLKIENLIWDRERPTSSAPYFNKSFLERAREAMKADKNRFNMRIFYIGEAVRKNWENLKEVNLEKKLLPRILLYKANLQQANLQEAILIGGRLFESHFEDANLTQAHLEGANLEGAFLNRAFLEGVYMGPPDPEDIPQEPDQLDHTNLKGAHLNSAHLKGADLRMADLTDAVIDDADLTDANLDGATVSKQALEKSKGTFKGKPRFLP